MITIPEKVEEIVSRSPYLREAISEKLINLSALARQIRPQITQELMKDVTDSAVFIALQRYSTELKHGYYAANPGKYLGNLSIRTDLFEVTVQNSPTLMKQVASLLADVQHDRAVFFVFTQGLYETTIVASNILSEKIEKTLKEETGTHRYDGLVALSLQRLGEHTEAVGVLQFPLRVIAWQGITVIEIISAQNEMMIILREQDIDKAAAAVRQALATAKQK